MLQENLIKIYEASFRENHSLPVLTDYFSKKTLTYFEMAEQMAHLHILFDKVGVKRGEKIALIGRNDINWCVTYIATITYGVVIVPILQDFNPADVENIITRATYSEDKARFKEWLRREYAHLPKTEVKYISSLKFKEFGRLSRKLLCGIEGAVNDQTGEYLTVIRTMWETNLNLMQILYADNFEFKQKIEEITKEIISIL
mgnify:CR=1 FL=1